MCGLLVGVVAPFLQVLQHQLSVHPLSAHDVAGFWHCSASFGVWCCQGNKGHLTINIYWFFFFECFNCAILCDVAIHKTSPFTFVMTKVFYSCPYFIHYLLHQEWVWNRPRVEEHGSLSCLWCWSFHRGRVTHNQVQRHGQNNFCYAKQIFFSGVWGPGGDGDNAENWRFFNSRSQLSGQLYRTMPYTIRIGRISSSWDAVCHA